MIETLWLNGTDTSKDLKNVLCPISFAFKTNSLKYSEKHSDSIGN